MILEDLRKMIRKVTGPSLVRQSLDHALIPRLQRISGTLAGNARVLDVGAKNAPYRAAVQQRAFETVDVRPDVGANYVADIHELSTVVPNASYDLVICTEVLEHVVDPARAVRELRRVLKPGGTLLATTPFIVPYHPDPGDYWRMTADAWRMLLADWTSAEVVAHGNQVLAVWYLMGLQWGKPLRLLDRVIFAAFGGVRPSGICLGYLVEAKR